MNSPTRLEAAMILPAAAQRLLAPKAIATRRAPARREGRRVHEFTLAGEIVPASLATLRSWLRDRSAEESDDPILLWINSPGGFIEGVEEASVMVRRLAERREVTVLAEGHCCSAAYFIASGATRIVASPSCVVGSIGTVIVLIDDSAAAGAMGVKVLPVASAPAKAIGMPGVEVTEGDVAQVGELVVELNHAFELALERSPRLTQQQVREALKAHIYSARLARVKGLVDEVALVEDVALSISSGIPDRFDYLGGDEAIAKRDELIAKAGGVAEAWEADDRHHRRIAKQFPQLAAAAEEEERRYAESRACRGYDHRTAL